MYALIVWCSNRALIRLSCFREVHRSTLGWDTYREPCFSAVLSGDYWNGRPTLEWSTTASFPHIFNSLCVIIFAFNYSMLNLQLIKCRACTMPLIPLRSLKVRGWAGPWCHNVDTEFRKNLLVCSKAVKCAQTLWWFYTPVLYLKM